jgi:hypothetical protein
MLRSLLFASALFVLGALAFYRGLRPMMFDDTSSLAERAQLVGGIFALGWGMIWLIDLAVTAMAPPTL